MNALKNALKYGLLLGLGLLVFGLCATAPASAQTASQSKAVVPRHPQPLPDLDSLRRVRPNLFPIEIPDLSPEEVLAATQAVPQAAPQAAPEHHGMPTPRYIEIMMDEGKFDQAVSEFTKYMDTVQGNPCDLLYLPFTFYSRLLGDDTTKTAFYYEKAEYYLNKYLQTCGDTWESLQLKENITGSKNPDSTVVWMTEAIALDSTVNGLYVTRGQALWELKRTREACADFKKAAELRNPEGRDLYNERCLERW